MQFTADCARPVPEDVAEAYREHHECLFRTVRRAVCGPDALIEDACQNAWLILLRRRPRPEHARAWLVTVAIREAYRLSARERRDVHLEDLGTESEPDLDQWEAVFASPERTDLVLDARAALAALAALPERQRRYMEMLAAGFSYNEIVAAHGTTYTNVNKHLARARARLRRPS